MTTGTRHELRDGQLLVVYAITLTGILANTMVAPSLPEIADHFKVSAAIVALVVTSASLPGVVVAPVIGLLSDRLGRRTVLVPCLLGFGFGGMLGMLAPTFWMLLAARLVQGVGAAGLINLAVVILGDRFEGPARAQAIGRNAAVLTAGLAVFPLIGGALTDLGGWRLAFAPYLLAFAVAVAVVVVFPSDRPEEPVSTREHLQAARPYLHDRRVQAMTLAGFVGFTLVFGLGLTALPLHLDSVFHLSSTVRGLILGLPAVVAIGVSLRMGTLAARFGTWDLVLVGFGALAVAFAGVAVAPIVGFVLLAALAWGLGETLVIVPLQTYATSIAPAEQRGMVVAMWVMAVRAGQAIGPILAGVAITGLGTRASFSIGAAIAVASVGVVAGVRHYLRVTRRRGDAPQEV